MADPTNTQGDKSPDPKPKAPKAAKPVRAGKVITVSELQAMTPEQQHQFRHGHGGNTVIEDPEEE